MQGWSILTEGAKTSPLRLALTGGLLEHPVVAHPFYFNHFNQYDLAESSYIFLY